MFRTITIGTAVFIQGIFVRALPDGRISVKLGDSIYTGIPVTKTA